MARGAAIATAFALAGTAPKISRRVIEMRDEAVHAGKYPEADKAESAIVEIGHVVCEFEAALEGIAPDRQPPFRLAQQMADWPRTATISGSVGLSLVLGGDHMPAPTPESRLTEYRQGRLRENLLD
jgi:hypothetical protein